MKLAIIHNERQAKSVEKAVKEHRDDIEISIYTSVSGMIDNAMVRHLEFDRILLFSNIIQHSYETDLTNLDKFIKECSDRTTLVITYKEGTNKGLESFFYRKMHFTNYCLATTKNLGVKALLECVVEDIRVLGDKYDIDDNKLTVEETYVIGEREEQIKKVEQERKRQEELKKMQNQPKKGGLFSKILGFTQGTKTQNADKNEILDKEKAKLEKMENDIASVEDLISQENKKFSKNSVTSPSRNRSEMQRDYDNKIKEMTREQKNSEANKNEPIHNGQEIRNENLSSISEDNAENASNSSNLVTEEIGSGNQDIFSESGSGLNVFIEVEEPETNKRNSGALRVQSSIEDGVFVGQAETEYQNQLREENTQVREVVITKEGKESVASALVKGKIKRTLIFTGDRCSGVTTSALKTAEFLMDNMKVLYVDFDIEKHGILNYINYDRVTSYGEQGYLGLSLVRNANSFRQCVVPYDMNLDILTCIYGTKVTKENLEMVVDALHEVALDYGAVIIDVPIKHLKVVENLLVGNCFIYCVNGDDKGYMDGLLAFETAGLQSREKQYIYNNGSLLVNHVQKDYSHSKSFEYIEEFLDLDKDNILSINNVRGDREVDMPYLIDLLR